MKTWSLNKTDKGFQLELTEGELKSVIAVIYDNCICEEHGTAQEFAETLHDLCANQEKARDKIERARHTLLAQSRFVMPSCMALRDIAQSLPYL